LEGYGQQGRKNSRFDRSGVLFLAVRSIPSVLFFNIAVNGMIEHVYIADLNKMFWCWKSLLFVSSLSHLPCSAKRFLISLQLNIFGTLTINCLLQQQKMSITAYNKQKQLLQEVWKVHGPQNTALVGQLADTEYFIRDALANQYKIASFDSKLLEDAKYVA
jgi:hypothetical protein